MPENEAAAPPQENEEPDTPIEELEAREHEPTVAHVLGLAMSLRNLRERRKALEVEEEAAGLATIEAMRVLDLHGVRFHDGVAVRRRWNPNRPKINPVKLAKALIDADEFLEVKVEVNQSVLRVHYPNVWRELGGKMTEGVAVYEPKKAKVGA